MFKKIITTLLVSICMLSLMILSVHADEPVNVKDYLKYLTDDEINKLEETIHQIREEHSLDTVIVITDDTEGKSSMEFADDYFDYNGYGIGDDYSGVLMLINMAEREVWISTSGKGQDIFNDSRIANMIENIVGFLSDGRYYDAANAFLDDVRGYAKQGVPSNQYRVERSNETPLYVVRPKPTYFQKVMRLIGFFPIYIAALLVSVLTTVLLSLSRRGKVTINRQTYEQNNSFRLTNSTDRFIRQTTTRTKIHRDSGNNGGGGMGGGSSVHTGSSGRSHGGGGGKF